MMSKSTCGLVFCALVGCGGAAVTPETAAVGADPAVVGTVSPPESSGSPPVAGIAAPEGYPTPLAFVSVDAQRDVARRIAEATHLAWDDILVSSTGELSSAHIEDARPLVAALATSEQRSEYWAAHLRAIHQTLGGLAEAPERLDAARDGQRGRFTVGRLAIAWQSQQGSPLVVRVMASAGLAPRPALLRGAELTQAAGVSRPVRARVGLDSVRQPCTPPPGRRCPEVPEVHEAHELEVPELDWRPVDVMVLRADGELERRVLATVGEPAGLLAPYRTRGSAVRVTFAWEQTSIAGLRLDAVTGQDLSTLTCVHTQLGQVCGPERGSVVQAGRSLSRLRAFSSTPDGVVQDGEEHVLAGP